MRPRTLFILAFLVAGLGAFVWFVERDLPGTEERAERAKKVLPLEADEVEAVVLQTPERRVRLEREPAPQAEVGEEGADGDGEGADGGADAFRPRSWRLVEPLAANADAAQVRTLVDSLVNLEKQRTLEEADTAELGLDDPRATVRVTTGEGEHVLAVGAQVPGSDSLVVAVEGSPEAYVVAGGFFDDVSREPGEWRDKSLFDGERADVQSIRIRPGEGEEVLIARRGKEFWLESPLSDRADRSQGERLLSDLVNLRATRFVDDPQPAAGLGLDPPAGTFQVVLSGREEPLRIEVGAPVSEGSASRTVRAGGQLAEVSTDLARWFDTSAEEWRSLGLTALDSWEIDAATVEDGEGTLRLERSGTDWKRGDEKVSFTPVSDLFAAVTDAEADAIVEPGPEAPAAGEPVLTLTLQGSSGQEEVVTLFPEVAEGVPARSGGREAVLLLPAEAAAAITEAVTAVREAEALPEEEAEEVEGIEVETEEGEG